MSWLMLRTGKHYYIFSFCRHKLPEAAEILYEVLNNFSVLEKQTPILICSNKQDLKFSRKAAQLENELEREIEELRKVRRATMDE